MKYTCISSFSFIYFHAHKNAGLEFITRVKDTFMYKICFKYHHINNSKKNVESHEQLSGGKKYAKFYLKGIF